LGPTLAGWLGEATTAMTDIAPRLLEYAELEARRAGLQSVTTQVLGGEDLDDRAAALRGRGRVRGPCELIVAAGTK